MLIIQCFECFSDNADFLDANPNNATEFYIYTCMYSTGRGCYILKHKLNCVVFTNRSMQGPLYHLPCQGDKSLLLKNKIYVLYIGYNTDISSSSS